MGSIKLLDCTLRDGGQGLQAGYTSRISTSKFTDEIINNSINHLVKTDIDIIELGYIEDNKYKNHPFANYYTIEEVSESIPEHRNSKQMYIALFTGPDTEYDAIPEWNPNLVEGTRVILRYSELKKSVDYCEMLSKTSKNECSLHSLSAYIGHTSLEKGVSSSTLEGL